MNDRREFLKSSVKYGVSLVSLNGFGKSIFSEQGLEEGKVPEYKLRLQTATKLFDGKSCWAHPRVGMVPGKGKRDTPLAVMTMNKLDLSGSDVFTQMSGLYSEDLSEHWTEPERIDALGYREEIIDGVKRPVALSDFWPKYHAASGKLLGTGHTVVYTPEWKVSHVRPRNTAYSVFDVQTRSWAPWKKVEMPDAVKFNNAGAGCVQRYDLKDGNILLPFYFSPPGENSRVAVARCTFDGNRLTYEAHGTELNVNDKTRGLHEPSLTRFGDFFYLTIRNDLQGYVTRSRDGLNFEPMRPWKFDDGSDLGNYNTQQHWVTHSEGLFLVYTRRGANNDHVFRHRAPLFMAQIDPERMCVIRSTENILIPQRGARLGNFGVTEVSPNETWVTESEWMQPKGVEQYGSDGSVYVAKILWDRPNKLFR